MSYKNDLPPDCPPLDEEDITDGRILYRITKHSAPQDEDFIPVWQLRQGKGNRDECKGKGISLYEDIEDTKSVANMYPKLGKYIHSGIIRHEIDGIVRLTTGNKPSHCTWYPYTETDEKEIFQKESK